MACKLNLAAVITKPKLPQEKFPWLEANGAGYHADRNWFDRKFGSRVQ